LPLHAGLFNSYSFSTKPSISGFYTKNEHPNNPNIKPQAQPGFFLPFNSNFPRQSRGQQNRGKMSDSETPRQVEYGYEDFPQ
jgi:hypothetical protein